MADMQFRGKRVSYSWYVVLTEAAEHVTFQLNSGRRTRAEQERLVREKGVWSPSNPKGAARYSPAAPHIRVGREDHALDVDTGRNGNAALTFWLRKNGLRVEHEIDAEPWHMEASSEEALIRLAEKIRDPLLRKGRIHRSGTRRLQTLLRGKGYSSVSVNGKYDLRTRLAVRRFQRKHAITPTKDTQVNSTTWKALRA